MNHLHLREVAEKIVETAKRQGATTAEASVRQGWELSVKVRLGEVDLLQEAGSRAISLRVIRDNRVATISSSDFSEEGIQRAVDDAIELCELSEADEFVGPADPELLKLPSSHPNDLELFDPKTAALDAATAISWATRAEKAALDFDPRIKLSEGATCSRVSGLGVLVLSNGQCFETQGSYASINVTPVVEDEEGKKRRDHHWTFARYLDDLDDIEEVGCEAARKTLARLGARKLPTSSAPVIFHRDMARSLIGTVSGCISGGAIWRQSSYLASRLNSTIASELFTLIDDPFLLRAPGSRLFDGEGVPSRKATIVDQGKLQQFFLDSYAARRLGSTSTASASRSGASIGSGPSNLYLKAGTGSLEDLIKETKRGLLVTEMMGFGFNAITGDYSRGAAGFWIENGEIAYPVGELTVSSNLDTMLKNIDRVGADLKHTSSVASPSFRIAEMTIAGNG